MSRQETTRKKRYNSKTRLIASYANSFRVDAKKLNSGIRISKPFSTGPLRGTKTLRITNADLSVEDINILAASITLSVDTETDGLDPRTCKLRLVTIADDKNNIVLVRNPELGKCPNLLTILETKSLIFHNAPFDIRFLIWWIGLSRWLCYCTKTLAKALYPYERSGLGSLVENLLKVKLPKDKKITCSNWAAPSLTKEQIAYAIGDVFFLRDLLKKVDDSRHQVLVETAVQRAVIEMCGMDYTQTYDGIFNLEIWKLWNKRSKELKC